MPPASFSLLYRELRGQNIISHPEAEKSSDLREFTDLCNAYVLQTVKTFDSSTNSAFLSTQCHPEAWIKKTKLAFFITVF